MQSIYKYLISLLLCLLVYSTQAQDKNKDSIQVKTKWWNGLTVQADIASLVSSSLSAGETYSMEGAGQINFKNKYYPIFELGFAGANKTSNEDINFKTNGLFGRVGVDFNLRKSKEGAKLTNNLFLAGVRLGMSSFAYDITNIIIKDDYWGGSETLNFNNQLTTKVWYEIVLGVKVEVFKNTYMGWTVRNKHLLSKDISGEVFPWYIPGFGKNNTTNWGISYSLGYRF